MIKETKQWTVYRQRRLRNAQSWDVPDEVKRARFEEDLHMLGMLTPYTDLALDQIDDYERADRRLLTMVCLMQRRAEKITGMPAPPLPNPPDRWWEIS